MGRLQVFDFKNHTEQSFEFGPQINAITGLNGSGKTNILDAIYYLSNTKSFFNGIDQQLIRTGAAFFSLHGWFVDESEYDILISFTDKSKKTVKKNGKTYSRLLDHIGLIQSVFITPYDISLVLDGSEDRRRFMDYTLCQTNREYLENLSFYKKIQDQRNAFLKKCEGRYVDPDVLESFDARLIPSAGKIFATRKQFIADFMPWFYEFYSFLSGNNEQVNIEYLSELHEKEFSEILDDNRERDRILMRTSSGIHKDDLDLNINGFPLKKMGSQGQIKSFVIAMKLAQYRFFLEKTGHKPLLLLDDIFEKIDAQRAGKLMELVANDYFGQIFITDTHAERVKHHLEHVNANKMYFSL
ncbi:MAG: DNA replication and repair protein RecF [Bacteroidetes bacterium]|nr:DNA replication and repair protein RecF [Bacteroidota bacterium]